MRNNRRTMTPRIESYEQTVPEYGLGIIEAPVKQPFFEPIAPENSGLTIHALHLTKETLDQERRRDKTGYAGDAALLPALLRNVGLKPAESIDAGQKDLLGSIVSYIDRGFFEEVTILGTHHIAVSGETAGRDKTDILLSRIHGEDGLPLSASHRRTFASYPTEANLYEEIAATTTPELIPDDEPPIQRDLTSMVIKGLAEGPVRTLLGSITKHL